jgi:cobalt/nickel transport system permease protein
MTPSTQLSKMASRIKRIPRAYAIYYAALAVWIGTTAMHIPDGYLSPATSLVMFLVVLPFWGLGLRKLREKVDARGTPLIALLAAFSFVIMMFNVPLPGGTTGHAVGGALAAIILGPEIACLAVSIALIIQAFFFGDGGLLAIGANSFNMAVILPYVSYAVYQWIAGKQPIESSRRVVAALIGGWVGLTLAAFVAGVELGIQPLLFHTSNGAPLYAPYPLALSIPAMVIPHALVASVVEGGLTALVVAYLQRANRPILEFAAKAAGTDGAAAPGRLRALWVGLAVLIVATPLGLLAPGTAWGEWSTAELTKLGFTFIPSGLRALEGLWAAPLAGYDIRSLGNPRLGYLLSAVLGIALVGLFVWLFVTLLSSRPRSMTKARH